MMENRSAEEQMLYCPFCSHQIAPQDILFVDVDQLANIDNETYDPEFIKFNRRVLEIRPVNTPDNQIIQMEARPVYKFHRWTQPEGNLPFAEPLHISMSPDAPFPDDIRVFRSKGMTPRQLAGDDPAPWAKVSSVETEASAEAEKSDERDKPISVSDALRSMIISGTANKQEEQEEAPISAMPDDATMTLTNRACPHCHCVLPEGFGRLPVYRVSMLGGTASGKTTYMTAAANLLSNRRGLPTGVIRRCSVCKESKRYFDFLIRCLEYNKLDATVKDDLYTVQFVFPIVLNVTTVGESENGESQEKEFILIINDIPGEAMDDDDFMLEYPGLTQANAAIMLMDPFQFIESIDAKKELARNDLAMLRKNTDFTAEDVQNHRNRFTPSDFSGTLGTCEGMVCNGKFLHLTSFTFVLNKLDLLYGGNEPFVNVDRDHQLTCINGQYDLNAQHAGGLDLDFIERLSNQVVYLIEQKLGYGELEYTRTIEPIATRLKPVYTMCISIRSWDQGQAKFTIASDEFGRTDAENIIGFRLLEPLLYSLYALGVVRSKAVPPSEEEDVPKGLLRRILDKLRGK